MATRLDLAQMISAEIAGMSWYDASTRLEEMGYTGWVHASCVRWSPNGWVWQVESTRWQDGAVVSITVSRPPYGYAAERDIAVAQCAVAISAILESRGGVCSQTEEVV